MTDTQGNQNSITPEQLIAQVQQLTNIQAELVSTINDLKKKANNPFTNFHIPDQIKIISEFNGNRKEAIAWIKDTQEALDQFEEFELEPSYKHIIRAVKSKIVGEAREVLIASGNPSEWEEIKEILLNAFGDKRDITSHLQSLFYVKQGKKSLSEYFQKVKAIDTAIKTTAVQMDDYKGSIEAVNKLISLITLTRYIDGLNGENLAMYVRSYRPKSLEEAHDITVQHSNASHRQKMETRQVSSSSSGFNTNTKYQNRNENPKIQNTNNHNTQNPNQQKPNSGKFRKFNNHDEDVSMKSHISKMQVNNHEIKHSKHLDEHDEEPDAVENEANTSKIESDDDDYFVGDEINFQIAGCRKTKG